MNSPIGVAVDDVGGSFNVYIADSSNHRVRKIDALTGIITTIAGSGAAGYAGYGGPATSALIQFPFGVNLDKNEDVYFSDGSGYFNVIRKVTVSTGIISTVAGGGSTSGGVFSGDKGPATAATLYNPHDVVIDSYFNLYITDRNNNRVRKVDA